MDVAQREGTADKNTLTTVLGLHWNTSLHKLLLTLKGLNHPTSPLTTKREVLQASFKLFGPLASRTRAFFLYITSTTPLQLHVFTDANTKAYGAVAYLSNQDQTSFVMAKGHVAPLKQITFSKLELMAAVIAAKLAYLVVESRLSAICELIAK